MRRPRIVYDGREYAPSPGRTAEEVRQEIATAIAAGRSVWLPVMHGERRAVPATLLVAPGTRIAVIDAVSDDREPETEPQEAQPPSFSE